MKDLTELDRIQLARSLFDAFAAGDLDLWQSKLAEDFTFAYPGMPEGRGIAAARAYNQPFNDSFSGWWLDVRRSADNGRTVFLDMVVHATMSRALVLPEATIPASGQSGAVPCVLVADIVDGKIHHEATYWNVADLMAQIAPAA
jgi:steroid delta-isomerase-like uncharacterized protein